MGYKINNNPRTYIGFGDFLYIAMNKEDYKKIIKFCAKGKCKPRENSYGVIWCVRCGKLHRYNTPTEPLKEEDKIIVEL